MEHLKYGYFWEVANLQMFIYMFCMYLGHISKGPFAEVVDV